jgi:hypothetical protein
MRGAIVGRRVEPQHQARQIALGNGDDSIDASEAGGQKEMYLRPVMLLVLVEMGLGGVECSRGCCG